MTRGMMEEEGDGVKWVDYEAMSYLGVQGQKIEDGSAGGSAEKGKKTKWEAAC